jgi:hypothetical protein
VLSGTWSRAPMLFSLFQAAAAPPYATASVRTRPLPLTQEEPNRIARDRTPLVRYPVPSVAGLAGPGVPGLSASRLLRSSRRSIVARLDLNQGFSGFPASLTPDSPVPHAGCDPAFHGAS